MDKVNGTFDVTSIKTISRYAKVKYYGQTYFPQQHVGGTNDNVVSKNTNKNTLLRAQHQIKKQDASNFGCNKLQYQRALRTNIDLSTLNTRRRNACLLNTLQNSVRYFFCSSNSLDIPPCFDGCIHRMVNFLPNCFLLLFSVIWSFFQIAFQLKSQRVISEGRKTFSNFALAMNILKRTVKCKPFRKLLYILCFNLFLIAHVSANSPPRFIVENSSEIVVHFREGEDTPVGTIIAKIKCIDPDNDPLFFGIQGTQGRDILDIRANIDDPNEAQLVLKKLLDREQQEDYQIILTLTDGKLGVDKYITQSLLLLVEDINDNVPIFETYDTAIRVNENSMQKVLSNLRATDRDEGPYGQVVYSLSSVDEKDLEIFEVRNVQDFAELRLIGDLDYERKSLYQLKVLAVDRSPGGRINTGTAVVVIEVEDVEDMDPTFTKVPPVTRIPEDIPVNSYVLQVNAIDGDRGINNPIRYKIVNGGYGFFELESSSGYLYVKQPLDREYDATGEAFFIKIMAEEVTNVVHPTPSVETEVTVILEDVNDQTPTFRVSHYVGEVAEGSQFNMPVNLIGDAIPEVYDNDQGINGTFALEIVGGNNLFDVTPSGGLNLASFLIRVKSPDLLDYEKVKEVNFTIVATEVVAYQPKSSSALVTVHITDTNDNIPEFSQSFYEISVLESAKEGQILMTLNATDPDSGDSGTIGMRYTDVRGSFANKVTLNETNGELRLKGSETLDRESINEIFITIEARDQRGKGNRNTAGVRIIIEDVNDNAPIFLQKVYQARILENTNAFTEPLIVTARDLDLNGTKNGVVHYEIVAGNKFKNFTIDSEHGEIHPVASLDFEAMDIASEDRYFNLTVKAYDLGVPQLHSLCQVLIFVEDQNDHRPHFEKLRYHATIREDTPGGTPLLQVNAHDSDGSKANSYVAYRIQSGATDKFVIEAETGQLLVAPGAILDPDRTQPRTTVYRLVVIAVDGGIGLDKKQESTVVIIEIKDVNNKIPIFNESRLIRLSEGSPVGTFIIRMQAVDLDKNNRLEFTLDASNSIARNEEGTIVKNSQYNYSSIFDINRTDGSIRLASNIDREMVETIKLSVNCEDLNSENGRQTASTTLSIIVEDINDNDPIFKQHLYQRTVAENAKIGTTIVNVVADDADRNKTITYTFEGSHLMQELLDLDNTTGEIIVRNRIDREKYSWLNLTVRATDSGIPPRRSFVDVLVKVLDENDNNPIFQPHLSSLTLREDAPVGTVVMNFKAIDADVGEYGQITYVLENRSARGYFKISSESGILSVAQPLNREEERRFDVIIEAWDNYQFGHSSGDSRNAFTQLTIHVADVNDEIPKIKSKDGCSTVTEFHKVADVITEITATDGDDPETPNGRIRFDIIGGNDLDLFTLRATGITSAKIVAVRSLVGYYGNYTLNITATDMGVPSNTVHGMVQICVSDFNDHSPTFVSPNVNVTIRVPENATVGSLVIRVHAIDEDIGINGAVLYRMIPDVKGHFTTFSIDQSTGVITLEKPLDKEKQQRYNIRVEAYDQGLPTPLSSDLDLIIYVKNLNDYQPQFIQDTFMVNFTEQMPPGSERVMLPKTNDLDDLEEGEVKLDVCYFILSGNINNAFFLDSLTHQLTTNFELDREEKNSFTLIIKATEDCFSAITPVTFFDPRDNSQLKLYVFINDINDNPPKFNRSVFTGGITTSSEFGHEILKIYAFDPDHGKNALLSYFIDRSSFSETLSEGLENLPSSPFLVENETGAIKLNFLPRQGMRGYFDFKVYVNDTSGMNDEARVFIYLLRDDQKVKFTLRMNPEEVRNNVHYLRESLSNVTGAIVNIDAFKVHATADGTVDKTKTDLYLHLVNKNDHSVLDVTQVLAALDHNVNHLDSLFKELNVLETQGAKLQILSIAQESLLLIWLVGVIAFLSILLIAIVALCLAQRVRYLRQLKAATATTFGSQDTGLNRSSTVPNTNLHSVEGSNPIWMSGFDNDWFKDEESLSRSDVGDSLDNNVVDSSINRDLTYLTDSNIQNPVSRVSSSSGSETLLTTSTIAQNGNLSDTFRSNVYQTFKKYGNPLLDKKLETTEL